MMKRRREIEVIVRGVCVKDGKLLVCQSVGQSNTFLPGGHVGFLEKAADGLEREIREEMGLKAVCGRFFGAVEHTFLQEGVRHCEVNLVFELDIPSLSGATVPGSCERKISFMWVEIEHLGASDLEPAPLRRLIPLWLSCGDGTDRWGSTYP
ncbi:MAG: NUDIX domain-containing protein [Kiritimatiellae bacterium]|nr:NUDIX domain-containing protein [Kiritimatiellia bacterium]